MIDIPKKDLMPIQKAPKPERLSREELSEFDQRFRVDPDDFAILSQQASFEKEKTVQLDMDDIATRYVSATAKLIAVMDGSAYSRSGELPPKPDYVIYLDKSARPVEWFVRAFWDELAVGPDGSRGGVKQLPHKFLNIDRLDAFDLIGFPVDADGNTERLGGVKERAKASDFDVSKVSREHLAGIRALFLSDGVKSEGPGWEDEVFATPTILDGKNLLIIDEVQNSGATLGIAQKLLKAAIPELASINGEYFWEPTPGPLVNGEVQMGYSPAWYDEYSVYGRGVGNVNPTYRDIKYEQLKSPKSLARKLGSWVLSTPHVRIDDKTRQIAEVIPDKKAAQLRQEVKKLKEEFLAGHVLFLPPSNYAYERRCDISTKQGFELNSEGKPMLIQDFVVFQRSSQKRKST